ncbi:MAG: inositol monophosphatase family protein [candidate division Zixibacteria bacterium]
MSEFLIIAEQAAREAGRLVLEMRKSELLVEKKGKVDLVTEADRRSEQLIRKIIETNFPNHSFKAEEGTEAQGDSEYLWLVDPLDGTTNYAHGLPVYCVSLGLLKGKEIIAGCIYNPNLDECFTAEAGKGAFLNGKQIHVSKTESLDDSLLATGFPYDIRETDDDNLKEFTAFYKKARAVRRAGAAALDLAYVACGRFDGFWEFKLSPWDIAAGILLVEEARGKATSYSGDRYDIYKGELVASNGLIHDGMVGILGEVRA